MKCGLWGVNRGFVIGLFSVGRLYTPIEVYRSPRYIGDQIHIALSSDDKGELFPSFLLFFPRVSPLLWSASTSIQCLFRDTPSDHLQTSRGVCGQGQDHNRRWVDSGDLSRGSIASEARLSQSRDIKGQYIADWCGLCIVIRRARSLSATRSI